MADHKFSTILLQWYHQNKRDLPWRNTISPYEIWLSEVILQQTRVAQGLPYFQRFLAKYPHLQAMAQADEEEILRLWQGLGYYSRARNMHNTAKILWKEYGGKFPDTYPQLLKLKGIGPYTAAAIASFAFDEKVAVVDGNVYRVLARVFGLEDNIASGPGQKRFAELAKELLPSHSVNVYNQAIMEFGALHCTPRNPGCLQCPLETMCIARDRGKQNEWPVKTKSKAKKDRYLHYLVLYHQKQLYLHRREAKDIWKGLYEFALVEHPQALDWKALRQKLPTPLSQSLKLYMESKTYTHILSHQRLNARFFIVQIGEAAREKIASHYQLNPYTKKQVEALPKPVLIDNFLKDHFL